LRIDPTQSLRFSLATDSDHVAHPVARRVLTILQDLRRRARATTPALLLAEAVERLAVQPILSACHNQFLQQMQAPLSQLIKLSFSFSSRHPLTGKGSLGLHEESSWPSNNAMASRLLWPWKH
jgi:hypothetical protein